MDSQSRALLAIVCAILMVFIGLRDHVGGDWGSYADHFELIKDLDFLESLQISDPGYYGVGWLVADLGFDVHAANLVCAAILMAGTFRFCRSLPNPWLALLVAVPYLLIVVGMGYTRQATALGLVMFGLVSFGQGRILSFVICVLLGALFHKTAALWLPIAGIAASKRRIWTVVWVGVTFLFAFYLLLQSDTETLWKSYVSERVESQGALVRVLMNVVPATLLLIYRNRFMHEFQVRRIWIALCWIAWACLPLVFFASTAVDRMALYLIPLQLFVFSRMPTLTARAEVRTVIVFWIVVYYAAVQLVWLNFAVERNYWVPYQFLPTDE